MLAEPEKAIRNYEELDATDQSCILDKSYHRVILLVEFETAEGLKREFNNAQKN